MDYFLEDSDSEFLKIDDLKVDNQFVCIIVKVYRIESILKKYAQTNVEEDKQLKTLQNNGNYQINYAIKDDLSDQLSPKSTHEFEKPHLIENCNLPQCIGSIHNLLVFDDTGSIRLQLINLTDQQQAQLEQGSVISIINGQCKLDENNHKILLTDTKCKFTKFAIYNKDDDISLQFCSHLTQNQEQIDQFALIMLNNKSNSKILIKEI